MYGVDMYYTVKTLISKGISQRQIAKQLGISRNTVATKDCFRAELAAVTNQG